MKPLSFAPSFALTLAVSFFAHAAEAPVPTIVDPAFATVRDQLASQGYEQWTASGAACSGCAITVVGATIDLQSPPVRVFLQALGDHKNDLMDLYRGNRNEEEMRAFSDEYNSLAKMAVGILGRESKFFTSTRYEIKEEFPQAVHVLKSLESFAEGRGYTSSPNSRGPTQIKVIPARVAAKYGITPDNISAPENAAIATVAFLIESLQELHRLAIVHQLTEITPANEMSYVPYIYFGSVRLLLSHQAQPDSNKYISDLRDYMSRVEIFEKTAN